MILSKFSQFFWSANARNLLTFLLELLFNNFSFEIFFFSFSFCCGLLTTLCLKTRMNLCGFLKHSDWSVMGHQKYQRAIADWAKRVASQQLVASEWHLTVLSDARAWQRRSMKWRLMNLGWRIEPLSNNRLTLASLWPPHSQTIAHWERINAVLVLCDRGILFERGYWPIQEVNDLA